MQHKIRRAGERARATDAPPWRARRLGPSTEDIGALYAELGYARTAMDATAGCGSSARVRVALDRLERATRTFESIAWCLPAARRPMLALRAAEDALVEAAVRQAAQLPLQEVDAARRLAHKSIGLMLRRHVVRRVYRRTGARPRQSGRRHVAAARSTVGDDSGDDPPEPPGRRRASTAGGSP